MNVTAQKFQNICELVYNPLARWNHRTTLPQSRPVGRDSSLREGAGRAFSIQPGACKTVGFRAIFIAPTEATFYRSMWGRDLSCNLAGDTV